LGLDSFLTIDVESPSTVYSALLPGQTRLVKPLARQADKSRKHELHVADVTFANGMGVVSRRRFTS
jgi:hypothetical protein